MTTPPLIGICGRVLSFSDEGRRDAFSSSQPYSRAVAKAQGLPVLLPPLATAPNTSPLVMRPSFPVPDIEPADKAWSAINLAAAGIATLDLLVSAGAFAALATGAAAAGADALDADIFPSVSMRAINCSAMTVPPSATKISDKTPAAGAGTSKTTLSVSISIRISSADTVSPAFFFHCNIVASATDSDNCGTFTSTIDMSFS
jgi:hypothetical protein